jgi:outer membrane protein, adhesin transport system
LKISRLFVVGVVASACVPAMAQSVGALKASVLKAITANPEVTSRFNAYQASQDEGRVASGAYYPRLDLNAEVGKTRDTFKNRTPTETQSLGRTGLSLTATQLLWDGLATSKEVDRLGHAKLTRYFEFVDASEQTALDTARANYDVVRYRRLVKLAEDNYVQHKYVSTQVESRARAGVARGVDLEQVGARLALADSNLTTERANLHDVSQRYLRLVGDAPGADNSNPALLTAGLPADSTTAMTSATTRSAAVAAAVENYRAVRSQSEEVKGKGYQPRVEARLRGGGGRNYDGIEDQKREINGAIVLNWNLYNGGSDQARVRQYANLINQAADLRDKACRDARQVAGIAFNDVGRLKEQVSALERNVGAIEKARDAYRQQFDIGQRSLLDLLNAENELYTAKRALVNAEHDLGTSYARAHSAAGSLLPALGLTRYDVENQPKEAESWAAGEDAAARCPVEPVVLASTSKADLDARAMSLVGVSPAIPAPVARVAPAAAAPAAAPVTPADFAQQRLNDWAASWRAKDVTKYMGFYSKEFRASKNGGRDRWLADRKRLVGKKGPIDLDLANIETQTISPTRVETEFDQAYKSNDYADKMRKMLAWQLIGKEWYIVRESNR